MKEKRKGCNLGGTEMNMESKKKLKNVNKSVDPQLWHASAGGMVQMPEVNSQVTWDEPELLKNVKRMNPWQVEVVSNMPLIPLSPFILPEKKFRLPQLPNFPLDRQFSMPTFPNNLLSPNIPNFHLPETTPAGMQGARHGPFGISLPDFHKFPLGLFQPSFQQTFNNIATMPMNLPNNSGIAKA